MTPVAPTPGAGPSMKWLPASALRATLAHRHRVDLSAPSTPSAPTPWLASTPSVEILAQVLMALAIVPLRKQV